MSSVGWRGRVEAEEREQEPRSVERFMVAANEALALTESNLPALATVYRDVVAEAGLEAARRFAELADVTAAGWDELKHPRHPKGNPGGGQFRSLAEVTNDNPKAELWVHENASGIVLDQIKVRPEDRGQGLASKALDDVLLYADEKGLPVALTIGHDPLDRGLSRAAKEKWYRSRGFVPNRGRNKDFAFTEAWIRPARSLTSAAWDESRVARYPKGTPISGPAGGGRFAPKTAAGTGIRRDETKVEETVRAYVQELADYFKERPEYAYTPERVEQEIEGLLAAYREEYEPGFRELEQRLAGIPGVTITPQLDEGKIISLAEGNTGIASFNVSLDAGDERLLNPDLGAWYWHRLEGEEFPDHAIVLANGDALTVEEPLDITDTDYFPADRPDLSGRYADTLDAIRGIKRDGFVTLHRGMSTAEAEAWEAGDEIPVGKFFTSSRTANMAQDVAGEFPELYSWKVARADVVETEPGVFQLRRPARLREDGTITAAGPPAWEPPPLDSLIDVQKISTDLEERSKKTRRKSAEDAIRPIMSAMGISFSMTSPLVLDLIDRAGKRAAALAIPGLEDTVRAAIERAFLEGLGVEETAALIAEKTTELAGYQAEMLARTDLIGMANGGSLIGAKTVWPEGGIVKRWVNATDSRTVNDGRIRPTHLEANGLVAELDGTFPVGEAQLLYPGDPSGPDGEVINCRCTLVYEEAPVTAGADWWWSDDLTSAAWDESRVKRYPKGTRVSGPEGGGRFAPKATDGGDEAADEPDEPRRGNGWSDDLWADVRAKYETWRYGAGGEPLEDTALEEMARIAGYDALPQRMESEELPEGWTRIYRGVSATAALSEQAEILGWEMPDAPKPLSAEQVAREFRDGDYWAGKGAFGNGTYFTTDLREAEGYAGPGGVVIEAALPPDALLSDHGTMMSIAGDEQTRILDAETAKRFPADDSARGERVRWRQAALMDGDYGMRLVGDPGRTAISRGLDGYSQGGGFGQGGGTFYVIQNRGIVGISPRFLDLERNEWREWEADR